MDCGVVVGGKYRILELLGEGGMGSVWRAEHMALRRAVAVKFIRTDRFAPEATGRFLREAQAAARVQHRNVIDIIDYGSTDEGQPYIVMEHLRGETLKEWLAGRPAPSAREIVEVIASALVGLEAVHEAGLVHRDLKPDNIFLSRESDTVIPKLLDFGVSRVFDAATILTVPGTVVGTPVYMSPEQALGSSELDLRSDIWSMGVILYEALAERPPFGGKDLASVLREIVGGTLIPLATLRPDLPSALLRVVDGALCRDPGQRFQTVRELRAALLAAVAHAPEREEVGGAPTVRLAPSPGPTEPQVTAPDRMDRSLVEPGPTEPVPATDRSLVEPDPTEPVAATPGTISVVTAWRRSRRHGGWAIAGAALLLVALAAAVVAWVGSDGQSPPAASAAIPTITPAVVQPGSPHTAPGPAPASAPASGPSAAVSPEPAPMPAPLAMPARTSPTPPPRRTLRARSTPAKVQERLPILDSPGF
jgi:serine/threonine-protein kinase